MPSTTEIKEIKSKLSDRLWRLEHLYYIKNKSGKKVLFKLNPTQRFLYDNIWFFNIIPKARQLGMTTFFTIFYLDQVLFSKNVTAGIIAHKQDDMKKIFRNKIRFAWDNLHPYIKSRIGEPIIDSSNEMSFPNGSNIFVSLSTRSGTVQFLHISEFSYVCNKAPEKAEEIVTGAINSVHPGCMVSIESTSRGIEGYFYKFCMDAERNRKEGRKLTPMDFKIFFFPWFRDPEYTLEGDYVMDKEMKDYFETLKRKYNIELTKGQKHFYIKKKLLMKDKIFEEYPSTLEESFRVSSEGAYYTKEMNRVYDENRIRPLPFDPNIEVETWWDIGMSDYTVILLTQTIGPQIRFIDMYWNRDEYVPHYVNWLTEQKDKKGYRYRTHNVPHDIAVRDWSSTDEMSRLETMYKLGLYNIRVAEKSDFSDGIDKVRGLFPKFYFDEEKCKDLTDALFNYKREFDKKTGQFKEKHKKDGNQHFADAVRVLAQLWREAIFEENEFNKKQKDQAFFS